MNADTCAVLASVFPLILITIVLERKGVHINLRSRTWFRNSVLLGMVFSLLGLLASVSGVELGGYNDGWAIFVWGLFVAALIALTLTAMGILATAENQDDEELKSGVNDSPSV
jgi:hypothetical protein